MINKKFYENIGVNELSMSPKTFLTLEISLKLTDFRDLKNAFLKQVSFAVCNFQKRLLVFYTVYYSVFSNRNVGIPGNSNFQGNIILFSKYVKLTLLTLTLFLILCHMQIHSVTQLKMFTQKFIASEKPKLRVDNTG